ncbi:hypothetical protein GO988_18730 [Hymenobacter sp. HMF4947]|uniref:DUF4177 domain-containing protein n=1 Tax=Hymenobacter ginkgonis TaxID=2682976 RepID=A0A7K1TJK6_9BACT|nr:hypothetical protein [Hymenobacter ginkgonis]MVN78371.1 hypothetical protein [Hymenobacter ginkgonis]
MLRLFLLSGLLALASPTFAQEVGAAALPSAGQYEYVTLVTVNGGSALLDYGQLKELGKQAPVTELEKEFVAVQNLRRAMLALNYLTGRGWEYVGMSSRQYSSGETSSGTFKIFSGTDYLLRRRKP